MIDSVNVVIVEKSYTYYIGLGRRSTQNEFICKYCSSFSKQIIV